MSVVLRPLYGLLWRDPKRRARKLLQFAEVEADGGRDINRAAELTRDPRLRQSYFVHARDERRHAAMFRKRGLEIRATLPPPIRAKGAGDWIGGGERGLDDVRVEQESDGALLAFLHLSEKTAAREFAVYRDVLGHDPETRALFDRILKDEEFHMRYTLAELERVSPDERRAMLWRARRSRLWKAYLRFASWLAGIIGGAILTLQYFILLPPFALLAKRAAQREPEGWASTLTRRVDLRRQY